MPNRVLSAHSKNVKLQQFKNRIKKRTSLKPYWLIRHHFMK